MHSLSAIKFRLRNQTLTLHPWKAVFWEEQRMLILADTHFGKGVHFRKAGIPVPDGVQASNFTRLDSLLQEFEPEKVLFLGDLFHSDYNEACQDLAELLSHYPEPGYILVKGNHDILPDSLYQELNLITVDELRLGPFFFTHEPRAITHETNSEYRISGHLHPAVLIRGNGKQRLRLPCFYVGQDKAVMPAFGAFTGLHILSPGKEDQVFVIVEDEVLKVS